MTAAKISITPKTIDIWCLFAAKGSKETSGEFIKEEGQEKVLVKGPLQSV